MKRTITALPIEPPFVLRIVRAVLFVWGIGSLVWTVNLLLAGSVIIDVTVVNLFAGTLLLRGSRSWRLLVLAELWYLFVGCGIVLRSIAQSPGPVGFYLFGTGPWLVGSIRPASAVLCVVIIGVWLHVVLCLPKVRAYFRARPWSVIDPSMLRVVERLEGLQQQKAEYDVVAAQLGKLDKAISGLEELRENLDGLDLERTLSEARNEINDLLLRATRIRKWHFDKGEAP